MKATVIRQKDDPRIEVSVYSGHFATRHSHNSHYIDITRIKHEVKMARLAAIELAKRYAYSTFIDTIVCMDGSQVLGSYIAYYLEKKDVFSVNNDKNINVITPEYNSAQQLIFRDNLAPMVKDKNVLLLISTVNSGKTALRALECIEYYGGKAQGIASGFSTMKEVEGVPVLSLFSPEDIPGYTTYGLKECEMCAKGKRIDALSNSFGISLL